MLIYGILINNPYNSDRIRIEYDWDPKKSTMDANQYTLIIHRALIKLFIQYKNVLSLIFIFIGIIRFIGVNCIKIRQHSNGG